LAKTTKSYNAVTAINAAYTGVTAKLTTQVTGAALSSGLAAGESVDFTVNGVAISYTAAANETANASATAIAAAANTAFGNAGMTIEAVVGDGTNGGPVDSLMFRNTEAGDESTITIAGIATDPLDPAQAAESKLSLTNNTYTADASHNTGTVTLFSVEPFTIVAGGDDQFLDELGWGGGGIGQDDVANDGQLTYSVTQGGVTASLEGLGYAGDIELEGTSFEVWLYNSDTTLALSQPVSVSLERAYDLFDVAEAINDAMLAAGAANNATSPATPWLRASVTSNKLVLTPDSTHTFAFGEDTTGFLQAIGINTFFTGDSAGTIGVNATTAGNLDLIAAGQVNERGEIYSGDNSNALLITNLQRNEDISFSGGGTDSFDGFYNALVADVGTRASTVNRSYEYNTQVTVQMSELRDAVSGVSLDEEMANLIRFQQAYSAAAKLISTSDEMLRTLISAMGAG